MNEDDGLEDALDQALTRVLRAPELPQGFRASLMQRKQNAARRDAALLRHELEAEFRQELTGIRTQFVRLRHRTLAVLLAMAFVAGTALTAAMPWLVSTFGGDAIYGAPAAFALIAVGMALYAAMRRPKLSF